MAAAPITEKFAKALDSKFESHSVSTTSGRKFDRVVISHPHAPLNASVHCFVERETGNIMKAAGWKAPAKDARFNISTDAGFADTVELADPYGSYLYKR